MAWTEKTVCGYAPLHFFSSGVMQHTLMTDRSLLIVRGGRNEPDPTFSCIAHSTDTGGYVAIELENGLVTNRTLYRGSERKTLETLADSPTYTSVYADKRTEKHLLPFRYPKHSLTADLNVFRRAKSDEEISSIQRMAGILNASREHARDENHFRGTVDSLDYRHAVQERTGREFTLKRYGLQDELGRGVELSSVEPHTLDWKARMMRVDAGCRAVGKQLREGVTGAELDTTFRSHLNPNSDVVYGSVLHHTGYQPWEKDLRVDVLRKYDVLTVCPIVGDKRGNSVPYMHSVHAITEQEFRGADASYERLFRAPEVVPSPPLSKVTDDDNGAYKRFTDNVHKVMQLWRAMRSTEEPTGSPETGNLNDILVAGIDQFIKDLSTVFFMKSYHNYASIALLVLPNMMLHGPNPVLDKWKGHMTEVYGVELSYDVLNFMRILLYWLIQTSLEVKKDKIEFTDHDKVLVALTIAFVAAPIVDDSLRFTAESRDEFAVGTLYHPTEKPPELHRDEIDDMWYISLKGAWDSISTRMDTLENLPALVEKKPDEWLFTPRDLLSWGWDTPVVEGEDDTWDMKVEDVEEFKTMLNYCLKGVTNEQLKGALQKTEYDLVKMLHGLTPFGEYWVRRSKTNGDVASDWLTGDERTWLLQKLSTGDTTVSFVDLYNNASSVLIQRSEGQTATIIEGDYVYTTSPYSSTRLEYFERVCPKLLTHIGPHALVMDDRLTPRVEGIEEKKNDYMGKTPPTNDLLESAEDTKKEIPVKIQFESEDVATKKMAELDAAIRKDGFATVEDIVPANTEVPLTSTITLQFMFDGEVVTSMKCGARVELSEEDTVFFDKTVKKMTATMNTIYDVLERINKQKVTTGKDAAALLCDGSMTMFVLRRLVYYLKLAKGPNVNYLAAVVRVLHVRFKAAYEKIIEDQMVAHLYENVDDILSGRYALDEARHRLLDGVATGDGLKQLTDKGKQLANEMKHLLEVREERTRATELVATQVRIEELETERATLQKELAAAAITLERTNEEYSAEIASMQETHQTEIATLSSDQGLTENAAMEALRVEHRERMDTLTSEHNATVEQLTAKLEQAKQAMGATNEALASRTRDLEEQMARSTADVETIQDLEGQLAELRAAHEGVSKAATEASASGALTETKVGELTAEVEKQTNAMNSLQADLRTSNEALQTAKESNETLQTQNTKKDELFERMTRENEQAQQDALNKLQQLEAQNETDMRLRDNTIKQQRQQLDTLQATLKTPHPSTGVSAPAPAPAPVPAPAPAPAPVPASVPAPAPTSGQQIDRLFLDPLMGVPRHLR